jgi:hypothetical protein
MRRCRRDVSCAVAVGVLLAELACGCGEPAPATADSQADAAQTALPCEVQRELAAHCWGCHGEPLQYTAPMKLLRVEDFHAPAPSDSSMTVAQRAESRIHDEQNPMPPRPLPALDSAELVALDAWLDSGAHGGGAEACDAAPRVGAIGTAGAGGANLAAADGGAPNANGVRCVALQAHAPKRSAPFAVNNASDLYECFEFNAPWGSQEVYGVRFKPRIDNSAVLHHMLLYQHSNTVIDGALGPCLRKYDDSTLIAEWAPGTGDMVLPDDVGMQLTATGYTLQVHYNGNGTDRSGLEVCYVTEPRAHTAAMHWLGTTAIAGTTASGVCRPSSSEAIHTLKYWPHMHRSGEHMKVTIDRADGTEEIWHDAPFDFAHQIFWDSDKVIMPGDTITTTCSYSQPSQFGQGTNQEMCFDVVLAYPVGLLTQPGGNGYATNQCFDGI